MEALAILFVFKRVNIELEQTDLVFLTITFIVEMKRVCTWSTLFIFVLLCDSSQFRFWLLWAVNRKGCFVLLLYSWSLPFLLVLSTYFMDDPFWVPIFFFLSNNAVPSKRYLLQGKNDDCIDILSSTFLHFVELCSLYHCLELQ